MLAHPNHCQLCQHRAARVRARKNIATNDCSTRRRRANRPMCANKWSQRHFFVGDCRLTQTTAALHQRTLAVVRLCQVACAILVMSTVEHRCNVQTRAQNANTSMGAKRQQALRADVRARLDATENVGKHQRTNKSSSVSVAATRIGR